MQIIHTKSALSTEIEKLKNEGKTIGFVPTMGALHRGHLSLLERSKAENDITVMSIFVNPTQFNDPKDYEKYPSNLASDIEKIEPLNIDILFAPGANEMYSSENEKVLHENLGEIAHILEGEKRKGHYEGVVLIVDKLLQLVRPDRVYMGLKDYQQVKVIEYWTKLKKYPIDIVGCPTIREEGGLAMSSRNVRLNVAERSAALNLSRCLYWIVAHKNEEPPAEILKQAEKLFLSNPLIKLEYLVIRSAVDLSEVPQNEWIENQKYVVLIAAFVGEVRLIDNMELPYAGGA